jgi:hypothetical protein
MNKRHIKKKAHFSGRRVGATCRVYHEITWLLDSAMVRQIFSMKNKASKSPLPDPIELAKLAAILRRSHDSKPTSALKVAMEFYVEAVLFSCELSSMSFEDIVAKFGSEKRWPAQISEPLEKAAEADWADTLELDPQKDDDPARQFLVAHGLPLKKARSVLDYVRLYCDKPVPQGTHSLFSRPSADAVIVRCERITAEGKKAYAIPKYILNGIIYYAKEAEDAEQTGILAQTAKAAKTLNGKTGKGNFHKSSV